MSINSFFQLFESLDAQDYNPGNIHLHITYLN